MTDIFAYTNYKAFLNDKLDDLDQGGRGSRAALSRAIGCQTAYTAQVLRGTAHFNIEQAECINSFLGHTDDQGDYFILILQLQKAVIPALKNRLTRQIEQAQEARGKLKNRLGVTSHLSDVEQATYYSSWTFGAIHALASIPEFNEPKAISERLGIDLKICSHAVEFLLNAGILEQDSDGNLSAGKKQIHLGSETSMIIRHHLNWRLRAMQAIELDPKAGLHYSSVVSLSMADFQKLREILIQTLAQMKPIIRESKEEEVASLSLDFFRL